MESPVRRIFKFNLIVMRILGFYPPLKFQKLYQLYAYAVYVFFTIPVPTLALVHLIIGDNITMAEVIDSSFIIFQVGGFIFKLYPFIFYAKRIRRSLYVLEQPIFTRYTEDQRRIMDENDKICKRNSWLFFFSCVFALTGWGAAPFLGSGHKFPIEIWLPFDPTSDPKIYRFIYIFMCIGTGNGALANGVIDPLVSGLLCFAATQLRILKNSLEFLGTIAKENINIENLSLSENRKLKNQIIYQKIKECISHHNAILDFLVLYQNMYSSVVFTQLTAAVLVICISCFRLTLIHTFTPLILYLVAFISTMLLEIYLYCYYGSSLYEESNTLTTAIYMGDWYNYDLKSKKALIILMERSKKPIVVVAGKILDLSLVTFTTVLRRAYSVFAVLNNMEVKL